MWRCGRRRGGVRFWLLRFEVGEKKETGKGSRVAGRSLGRAKARPYICRWRADGAHFTSIIYGLRLCS